MSTALRRASVCALAGLLLVTELVATPALAQDAAAPDAAARASVTEMTPGPLVNKDRPARAPAFEAAVVAETPLRPQGVGRLRVTLARQRQVAVKRGIKLAVRLPKGVRSDGVGGAGWRCKPAATRMKCQYRHKLSADAAPRPVTIKLAAGKQLVASNTSVRARWQAADGKREADGGQAQIKLLPALQASFIATPKRVAGTPRVDGAAARGNRARSAVLTGQINGAVQRPVAYRFQQLCTTARSVRRDNCAGRAKPVRWLSATGHGHASAHPSTSFQLPAVAKNTPLLFRLRATGDGARTTATKRMIVEPVTVGTLKPRPLRKAPQAAGSKRSDAVGHRHGRGLGLRINGGTRPLVVQPGAKVRLRARTARKAGLKWRPISAPTGLFSTKASRRARLVFKAPTEPRQLIVGVTAKGAKGRTSSRDRIVRVVAADSQSQAVRAASVSATDSPFCVAYGIVSATPANPSLGQLTLGGATTSGADCSSDGATISFTSVTIDGQQLSLSGSIDAAGALTGTYTPDADWGLSGVQITDIAVTASLAADGSITGLTGTASGSGVPFVSLPQGWTGTTSLTLTSDGVALTTDASDGTAATSGDVNMTGSINFDGTFSLAVTAANLAVLTTVTDSDATASGTGTIKRTAAGGPVSYDVTASFRQGGSSSIQLFDNVILSNASASLDATGISASGDLAIDTAGADLDLAARGSFSGTSSYNLAVTQPAPWSAAGVSLSGLTGTLVDNGTLTFDVAGSAADTDISELGDLSGVSLTGQVTNTCPPKAAKGSCDDTAVQLILNLSAQVSVPGEADPVSLNASADVDFATMDYSFSADLPDSFGPAELNLSNLAVTLSNQPNAAMCTAAAGGDAGELQVGFSGQADVLGVNADVAGVFTGGNDYCLQVDLAGAGFNPDDGSGGADSAFTGATLLYSTTGMTATVPGGPGGSDQSVTVAQNSPTLVGTFVTPQSLQDIFDQDLPSSGAYSADVTMGEDGSLDGFDGTADLELQQAGALLAGSRGGTSLTLNSIGVTVSYDTDQAKTLLGISANGDFNTDGGGVQPGTYNNNTFPVTGQSTPISGQLTATLSAAGTGLAFDVGIDPTQTAGCPAGATPCITNAFGQSGLTVSMLSVGGSIQATDEGVSPAVDVAADADLPSSWTSSFGSDGSVPVSLAVQLSEMNPCFELTVGNPDGEQAVISMADGLLTADYAEMAIAPAGCAFHTPSGDVQIPAGSSLAFDGAILGDPFSFNAVMGMDDSGTPTVKATIASAPIDFAGGAVQVTVPTQGSDGATTSGGDCGGTTTQNDNSPTAGGPFVQVDTSADGGASACGAIDVGDTELGGAGVTVAIQYWHQNGVPDAQFDVNADLSPGGFPIAQAQLRGQYVGGASPSLNISLVGQTSALGVSVDLQAQLDYEAGLLQSASFFFGTNADIFGILDVSVGFTLSYLNDQTTQVGTTTFSYEASAALFGWSIFHFGGTIFTTTGGWQEDGSPLPPPPPPPAPPIQISATTSLEDAFVEVLSQVGYPTMMQPGSQMMACAQPGCYYLYRDVAAPIAPNGTIATATGDAGGTPGGSLLVCFATKQDQQQNQMAWVQQDQQLQAEHLPRPQMPANFIDPNVRSATQRPSDPTGTDSCVSLAATYNVDDQGNLYIASAGTFDLAEIKALGTTS